MGQNPDREGLSPYSQGFPSIAEERYHKIDNYNTVCSVPSLGKSEKTFQRK